MQKSILITGCSSGIGRATCHYLRDKGYRVFACARKQEDVAALQEAKFETFLLDVTNSQQIASVVSEVKHLTSGHLYALCNNAGYAQPGALEDLDKAALMQQFETNVFGLQELTNHVLPLFRLQGFGRIIHISSVLGLVSMPYRGAYNASKYAVEGLADTLRLELRKTSIYVSLIEPGPIQTCFRDNALAAYNKQIDVESSVHGPTYTHFLNHFSRQKNQLSFSQDPIVVAKKIFVALESKRPKPRYFVTAPTYLLATLKRLLPTRTLDFLLGKISDQEIKSQ